MLWLMTALMLLQTPTVDVAPQNRVRNQDNQCVIACLDTMGRHHRIPALIGLMDRADRPQSNIGVWSYLQKNKVSCLMRLRGKKDWPALRDVIDKRCGAVAEVTTRHAVIVVGLEGESILILDPNTCEAREWSRAAFDRDWTGFMIVVRPPK